MSTLEQDRTADLSMDQHAAGQADRAITSLERCDSCGAQAYVRATLAGSELLFCGHHAKKHEEKLRPMAEVWHDESHKITA